MVFIFMNSLRSLARVIDLVLGDLKKMSLTGIGLQDGHSFRTNRGQNLTIPLGSRCVFIPAQTLRSQSDWSLTTIGIWGSRPLNPCPPVDRCAPVDHGCAEEGWASVGVGLGEVRSWGQIA